MRPPQICGLTFFIALLCACGQPDATAPAAPMPTAAIGHDIADLLRDPPKPGVLAELDVYNWQGQEREVDYDWDEDNVEHIARHRVSPEEAEEAAGVPRRAPHPAHSGRRAIIGMTIDGRLLMVVVERRGGRTLRVITARDATRRERAVYRRHNR